MQSEFWKTILWKRARNKLGEYGYTTEGDKENLTFVSCMEIMLSKNPKALADK